MDFLLIFIEGLASFISPCVLPMLPMYISYFAGQDKNKNKTILNSIGFVLGFSFVFILLGVFASTFGRIVNSYSNYINIIVGVIIILFGLHYAGILNINVLNKTKGIKYSAKDLSFITSALFGMFFSITWTPCVGVFLSSALMMSATQGSIIQGLLMLVLYSLGLGIPFIITAIFLEKLKTTFDFIKQHYNIINKISGIILIISGLIIIFR